MKSFLILCFFVFVLSANGQYHVGAFEYHKSWFEYCKYPPHWLRSHTYQKLELKADSTFSLDYSDAYIGYGFLFTHKSVIGVRKGCRGTWSFNNDSILLRPAVSKIAKLARGYWDLEQDTVVQILSPNKLKYNGYIMKRKKPKQK